MSNYTQSIDFSDKDALPSGNPAKLGRGADLDTELGLISVAIATKEDSANKGTANGYAGLNASSALTNNLASGSQIPDDGVANTKLANMAAATVKGQIVGGSGDPVDLTAAQLVDILETADGAGTGLDADTLDGVQGSGYSQTGHAHAAGDVTSGTFVDARVAQSNVTQHQTALAINTDQLTTDYADDAATSFTVGSGDAESIRRFTSSSAITITLPSSTPSGWAIGDSMGFIRGGTGTLTFSSAGTIRTPGSSAITVQHGKAVVTLAASGVWELSGNI